MAALDHNVELMMIALGNKLALDTNAGILAQVHVALERPAVSRNIIQSAHATTV